MKQLLSLAMVLLSLTGFSWENVLKDFPAGTYLGEGRYVTSARNQGSFSSFAKVSGNEWDAAYLRDGKLTTYNAQFTFTDDAFYEVLVTQLDSAGSLSMQAGLGYCIGNTCHLDAFLSHGILEETVRFLPKEGRIERIGSLLYLDENQDSQTVIWEEKMVRFNANLAEYFPDNA